MTTQRNRATTQRQGTAKEKTHTLAPDGMSVVHVEVKNVAKAKGFGVHIAPTEQADGYGGAYAECHFLAGSVSKPKAELIFLCYDGYENQGKSQNEYRVDLGPKADIHSISLDLTSDSVRLVARRLSKNKYNDKRHHFAVQAVIPIRRPSGFWSTGELHIRGNGVLNGRADRKGAGYVVITPYAHPVVSFEEEAKAKSPMDEEPGGG